MRNRQGTDRIASPAGWAGETSSETITEHANETDQAWNRLEPAIEGEIIPRLMMAFQQPCPIPKAVQPAVDQAGDLDEFVELVLGADLSAAIGYIQNLCSAGSNLKTCYLSLITSCARRLGELWNEDRCSFFDVTAGTTRLRQVMLELSPQFCGRNHQPVHSGLSALILPAPGEQHTLGQFMVVEFFRRAGWNVHATASASTDAVARLVERQSFAVVGLSVSADRYVDDLADVISRVRDASSNPELKVLIGGRAVAAREGIAEDLGADATAGDGQAAVAAAERLVDR